MSYKKIIAIVVVVLVVVLITTYFFLKGKGQQNIISQPVDSQANVNIKNNTIARETAVIGKIQQNTQGKVFLDPAKDAVFNDNKDFSIVYYTQDKSFFITLLNSDIWTTRPLAEQGFLENFKLSKEDACMLKVSLGVPYSVNADASGKDYSLSFCPYGKPLPKK
jgi:hypothetical protein